jgi:predicted RND superfamily exporter protein
MSQQPNTAFHRIALALVFGQRTAMLVVFAVLTVIMAYFASQLQVEAGFKKQIPLQHEYMQTFLEYEREFGGANRVLVALVAKDGQMFDQEFFATLEKVTQDVMAVDAVDDARVRSLFTPNVRFVEVVEDGFAGGNVIPNSFTPNVEGWSATERDFETVRGNIVKANIVGRLVAKDWSGAMVWAELVPEDSGTPLDYQQVADQLESIRQRYESEDGPYTVHIIGFAKIVGDIADGAASVVLFFGITVLLTLLLLAKYVGSFRLSLVGVAAALTAVIWTLGTLRILGFGIDPMNILTPFLVFAIGVSHGVQMLTAWVNERLFSGNVESVDNVGPMSSPLNASRSALAKLLVPGTVALASDVAGFVTILLIPIRIIQELAITASIGVGVVILTNLILLPLLLSKIDFKNAEARREHKRLRIDDADPLWEWLSRFSEPRTSAVTIAVVIALGIFGYIYGQNMQVGDSEPGVPELRAEARFNQDAREISERFSLGLDSITVIAEARPGACTESFGAMEMIDRFAWHLSNVEGVQQVISLPQATKIVYSGWNDGSIRWRVLPRDSDNLRVATQGFETDSGLLNTDCSAIPVTAFLTDHKATTINRVVAAVKEFRETNAVWYPGENLRLRLSEEQQTAVDNAEEWSSDAVNLRLATGNVGVMAATNDRVTEAQYPMLALVYAAVIVLCLLAFRSLRATIAIVIPLVVVSLLANALMAAMNIGLKVNTLPVAALGVGIGVDYAIYIYSRMRYYLDNGMRMNEAYHRALEHTGAAVLFTALTLAVGVGTWIFSELQFQADMGILLSFFFLTNMVGAIVVLPALLRWLVRPPRRGTDRRQGA